MSMRTIVVMPAYNAAATLSKTIADIPLEYVDEIILVDDASQDDTVDTLRRLVEAHPRLVRADTATAPHGRIPCSIIRHAHNKGYGGNQKTCYQTALARGADIVVMLHPDYQYDPRLIKYFVEFIRDGYFHVMLGSRIRSREEALAGGMPPYKYYANRILTFIENIASGRALGEWHTGMRAYSRDVLETVRFERFSDDFVFDTQMLFAVVECGYTVGDIPVPVRYFKEASSINFVRSCRYGLLTLWETGAFLCRVHAQALRYIVVGVLSVAANLAIYTLLLRHLHWWYLVASVTAFCCGGVVSFTLHKFWTFGQRSIRAIPRELPRYLAVVGSNMLLTASLVFVFVQGMDIGPWIANVYANVLVAVWSYIIFKHLVFRERVRTDA